MKQDQPPYWEAFYKMDRLIPTQVLSRGIRVQIIKISTSCPSWDLNPGPFIWEVLGSNPSEGNIIFLANFAYCATYQNSNFRLWGRRFESRRLLKIFSILLVSGFEPFKHYNFRFWGSGFEPQTDQNSDFEVPDSNLRRVLNFFFQFCLFLFRIWTLY